MNKIAARAAFVWLIFSFTFAHADWHEGEKLHNVNGYEWLEASETNKLATIAEILNGTYQQGLLNPEMIAEVESIDDFRPHAEELVNQIDAFLNNKLNDESLSAALSEIYLENEKGARIVLQVMHEAGLLNLGLDRCSTC